MSLHLSAQALAQCEAVTRFFDHRQALDLLQEPVALIGPSGRHLHRNAALMRLLDADPERDRVVLEMDGLAQRLQPLGKGYSNGAPVVPAQQVVRTHRAAYTLRGTLVGPCFFAADACILLTVASDAGPALPDVNTIRTRHGLTRRETEVALLLAEGLSNDGLAERLFISPHTARRHTENVLAKLGLHSRKALALKLMQGSAT
jgi:DNA-binding CsgD family transcriptional regulator